MKKKGVRLILFTGIATAVIYLLNCILCVKSPHGVNQARYLYYQPEHTVDVLFLGSSHVHCNVDTKILWRDHGMAAYLCTGAEQPLWNSYYDLVEALKYQSPKAVVLDMYCPVRFTGDFQEKWADQNLGGMRLSLNKYRAALASVDDNVIEYLLGFTKYHSRYDDLEEQDFRNFYWDRQELARWKGYTPQNGHTRLKKPETGRGVKEREMTGKSQEYFNRIVELTRERNISLVLVTAPYQAPESDQEGYRYIAGLADELGIPFLNYNSNAMYDETGLDFERDFADDSHLNERGSAKYTEHLGKWLKEHLDIPDRRGQPGYDSWERQKSES